MTGTTTPSPPSPTLKHHRRLRGRDLKPNGNITRAEFATIAVRFFEATYEGENLFPDIDGHWAQDYINEAANA